MSNELATFIQTYIDAPRVRDAFNRMNVVSNVIWEQECTFAKQQVLKNDFTLKVAKNNPHSLGNAIINVAAIGISLNPANQHAYLVPRDNQICLDISYRGLVKLATDCGAIEWAKAELVYEKDTFTMNGISTPPTHSFDPFGERGGVKGGYCVAKLSNGDYMVEAMSLAEIKKIQDVSKAKNGPWVQWWEEMAKKTILKRASKSWPQTSNRERWDKAISVLNENEGITYTLEELRKFNNLIETENALEFFIFIKSISELAYNDLYNSGAKGVKTKLKDAAKALEYKGAQEFQSLILDVISCIESDDNHGLSEIVEGLPIDFIKNNLNNEHALKLEQML